MQRDLQRHDQEAAARDGLRRVWARAGTPPGRVAGRGADPTRNPHPRNRAAGGVLPAAPRPHGSGWLTTDRGGGAGCRRGSRVTGWCAVSVTIKSPREVEIMRAAGRIVANTLVELRESAHAGMTTKDLDRITERSIKRQGAVPAFPYINRF